MKANTGHPDRLIRAVLAMVLLALGIGGILNGVAATIAIIVGAVMAITALLGFCPMYTLMGKNTLDMGE